MEPEQTNPTNIIIVFFSVVAFLLFAVLVGWLVNKVWVITRAHVITRYQADVDKAIDLILLDSETYDS